MINLKVEQKKLNLRVSTSKFNLIFHEVELVTQKKNFYENFRVSNSKCDVILRNSVLQLDFATQEFRASRPTTSEWKRFQDFFNNMDLILNSIQGNSAILYLKMEAVGLWMKEILRNQLMMMNCFCGMVDRRKAINVISSRDHCQNSEFRLNWMKLCSSDNHYTVAPIIWNTNLIRSFFF